MEGAGKAISVEENGESSHVAAKRDLWQHRMDEIAEKDKHNPFSRNFAGKDDHVDHDEHYGRPPEGSLTEMRGQQATAWVDKEVDKLIGEIKKIGKYDEAEGGITVLFGDLFLHYQDISNTVVGILMRAKKRNRVKYEGQMLFQGASNHTKITVIE